MLQSVGSAGLSIMTLRHMSHSVSHRRKNEPQSCIIYDDAGDTQAVLGEPLENGSTIGFIAFEHPDNVLKAFDN